MNAREFLDALNAGCCSVENLYRHMDLVKSALRLLAAAESNDGTTPETDSARLSIEERVRFAKGYGVLYELVPAYKMREVERERNGLAARVAELEKDAERYRWIRNRLEVRGQQAFTGSVRPGISVRVGCSFFDTEARKQDESTATKLDAAIDAARSKP